MVKKETIGNYSIISVDGIIEHRMASLHRLMNEAEYAALLLSIREEGQLIPVIFYRGKLVDGRHRLKALLELGIKTIKIETLSNNLTLADIENKVLATENRRADTVAQKAIRAFRWLSREKGRTQEDAAVKFAVSRPRISDAKRLEEKIGTNELTRMYSQGYLYIGGKKHTQLSSVIKAIDSKYIEPKEQEPLTSYQVGMFQQLDEAFAENDIISLAMIKSKATVLIAKLNEN